jgi:hypothetical protein
MSSRRPFDIQIDTDTLDNADAETREPLLLSSSANRSIVDDDHDHDDDDDDMHGFVDDYFSRARGSIVATASFIALSFTVTAILFSVAAFTTLAEAFQLTWMFVVATLMNLILAIAGCLRRRVSVSAFVWVYCITMALEAIAVSVEGVLELDDISMMPRDSGSGNRGETTVVLAAAVLIGMRPVRFWLPAAFFAAVLATNTLWNWFTVHRVYPEAAFVAFATVLFVAIAALRERTARQQYALRRRVAARLQQLQALLANILPFSFARRLARSGDAQAAIVTTLAEMRETVSARAIVDEFDCVTLMFLELCNFRDLVREARGDGRALVGELLRRARRPVRAHKLIRVRGDLQRAVFFCLID